MARPKNPINPHYIVHGIYSLEDVLPYIIDRQITDPRIYIRKYDGIKVDMRSLRYLVFHYSIVCVQCGISGSYFKLERCRHSPNHRYHFNLYAIGNEGKEILMTKDHIIPRSRGGKDSIDNLQTMCQPCNQKKADT